jgi:hypothetical protein
MMFDKNIVFAHSEITSLGIYNNNNGRLWCRCISYSCKKITLGNIDIAYKIFGKGEFPHVLKGAWLNYHLDII